MKLFSHLSILSVFGVAVALSACSKEAPPAPPAPPATYQAIAAKITIAGKDVDSVVEWNTATGEARLLNAASYADKSTGAQGNLIGWVPLGDLTSAVQNLASRIQAQQAQQKASPSPEASPSPTKGN